MSNRDRPPRSGAAQRLHVAGLTVVACDVATAMEELWADVQSGHARVYALVNAYSATLRRQEPRYAALLDDASVLPLPDGAALTIGGRLLGYGHIGRCPGPDLFESAARSAAHDGVSFYLLGGGPGVVELLADRLRSANPGLVIAGCATPPFGEWPEEESLSMCRDIRESGADVVWLGVSAPKQEVWAARYLDRIGKPVVCVGAAFDFLAGSKPRAPQWIRSIGMEWLFRLLSEPRRLWKRYLVGNAVFVADLLRFRGREAPVGESG